MKREGKKQVLPFLFIGLVVQALSLKIELDKNIELEITGELVQNRSYSVLQPYLGRMTEGSTNGQRMPLIADLTYDKLMIANVAGSSYGIDCQPELLCEIDGYRCVCDYRFVSVFECQAGRVLLRYKDDKAVDDNVEQIDAFFFNSTAEWEEEYGKQGVFGMSPSSPIWNYFVTAYNRQAGQEEIETSLSYKLKDYKTSADERYVQLTESYFTVNGRSGINEPIVQRFKKNRYKLWVYEGATVILNRNDTREDQKLCVDNTRNAYFIVKDVNELKRKILFDLCMSVEECSKATSNLKNVDPLQIKLESSDRKSFVMVVKPEEFINFDESGKAIIALEDLRESSCKFASDSVEITMGIGRLMLTKIEFVVRVVDENTFDIGFNEINYPKDTVFLIILIVLGAIIGLIIIGILIASTISQKKTHEEHSKLEQG